MPTIILEDTIPQRAPLRAPQLAEQLVDVPLPAWMQLALGTDAAGRVCTCVWKQSTGVYWCLEGSRHTQWTAQRASPPAQGGIKILGKAEACHGSGVGVPVITQLKFQQSFVVSVDVLRFRSSTGWWIFQLPRRDWSHSAYCAMFQTVQKTLASAGAVL